MNIRRNTTPTCDAVQKLHLSGNVTPHLWYRTIRNQTLRGSEPHLLAISILSDIVFWHRPTEVRDEHTGQVIAYEKKFTSDKLQRNYQQIADFFGISYKVAREACKFLEELGILILSFRDIKTQNGTLQNVCFMDLNVAKLTEFTFPTDELIAKMSGKKESVLTNSNKTDSPIRIEPITQLGNRSYTNSDIGDSPIRIEPLAELGNIYIDNNKENYIEHIHNTFSPEKILTNFSGAEISEIQPAVVVAEKEKKEKKVAPKKEKIVDPKLRSHLHSQFVEIYDGLHEELTKTKIPNSKWKQQLRGIEGLRISIIESVENFRIERNQAAPTDEEILNTFRNFVKKAWAVSDAYNQGQFSPNHLNSNFIQFTNKIKSGNNGKSNNQSTDKLTVEQRNLLDTYKPTKPVFTGTDFTPANFGNVG